MDHNRVPPGIPIMQPKLYFIYGISCYATFLAVLAWMALFVGDLLLPHTVDVLPAPAAKD